MVWIGEVIQINWDTTGRITHHIEGSPFGQNHNYWALPSSSVVLLGHQLGTLKPSIGMNLCSRIIDILTQEKYQYLQIDKTLKSAKIEFLYVENHCASINFVPKYSFVHDNNKLELGACQLVLNYYFHVLSQISQLSQLTLKFFTIEVIEAHFSTIENLLSLGNIGQRKDRCDPLISHINGVMGNRIFQEYMAPDEWDDEAKKMEISENINIFLNKELPSVKQKYAELYKLWIR